jgi:uncharacterized protein (DUF2237 family)
MSAEERNVFGDPIEPCSTDPMTGFYRNGHCWAGPEGTARHLVCVEITDEFLAFSKAHGNDLSTPRPEFAFPGLTAGERWCVHAARWVEAWRVGQAPRIALRSTHEFMLDLVPFEELKKYAVDLN